MLPQPQPPNNPPPPLRVVGAAGDNPEPLVVDIKTAAAMLLKGRRFVIHEIEEGHLRAFRLGRRWRIKRSELDAYMRRREQGHPPPPRSRGRGDDGKYTPGGPTPLFS